MSDRSSFFSTVEWNPITVTAAFYKISCLLPFPKFSFDDEDDNNTAVDHFLIGIGMTFLFVIKH